jgi:thioredoxin 1
MTPVKRTLIEFWATWCQPCKVQHTELDRLAELRKEVKVLRYDIAKHPDLVAKYNVKTVPYIIYEEDGKSPLDAAGLHTAEKLIKRFGL